MKIIFRKSLLFFVITSFLFPKEDSIVTRGYGKIRAIDISVSDNPIITKDEVIIIVKSIGYSTLPNYIHYGSKYDLMDNLTREEMIEFYNSPTITLEFIITAGDYENEQNKYWGHVEVNLKGDGESQFVEVRFSDTLIDSLDQPTVFKDKMRNWMAIGADYDIIDKGYSFKYYDKDKVINIMRRFIQEIFDELNILIRENP